MAGKTNTRGKKGGRRARRGAAPRADVYAEVTDKIVAALERGVRPWMRPWNVEHAAGRVTRPLRHAGEPYRGINVLVLWMAAEEAGFASPYWLTYRQAKELGGSVRKGERSTRVVYASTFTKTETDGAGEEIDERIPYLKAYSVFNADQLEGLPERYAAVAEPAGESIRPIERVTRLVEASEADVRVGGTQAFYAVGPDYIRLPPVACFRDAEAHAATLTHELCHWTRHPSRLDRDLGRKRFGDAGYAMEELVAERGAAFLGADLGVTPTDRDDHASYVAECLKVLEDDKRAVFTAASHASRAVEYLHAIAGGSVTTAET